MRYHLFAALLATTVAHLAMAQPLDVVGGPGRDAQTIHPCGYLPTLNAVYTDSAVTTRLVQEKLAGLGFYAGPFDGKMGKKTKKAVRRFQTEYGIAADGVVGMNTAQRLAYFSNPAPNVRRCWRLAQGY